MLKQITLKKEDAAIKIIKEQNSSADEVSLPKPTPPPPLKSNQAMSKMVNNLKQMVRHEPHATADDEEVEVKNQEPISAVENVYNVV